MTVSMQNIGNALFSGMGGGMKSTQEKAERQQKCAGQVDFFEKQKENLKTMQCDSLEDIARKLEMFHSYEDQIAAAKKQYNNSQMSHVLDEAREIGEKIAEAAEKMAPKTAEERQKDLIEEAAGTEEESKGLLEEMMEEIEENLEETLEEILEETEENLEETSEEAIEEMTDGIPEENLQETADAAIVKDPEVHMLEKLQEKKMQEELEEQEQLEKQKERMQAGVIHMEEQYRHIDYRL